jgi:hypothetical protein
MGFLDLNLSWLGWPHTFLCVTAMAAFFPVMLSRKGGNAHLAWGRRYTIAYAAACVTSLGIYRQHKFWFPHWLAVGGLVVLGAGYLAARFKPPGWRYVHIIGMLLSASNLFGGAITEAFLRIRPLRPMLGSPVHNILQTVTGQVFFILIIVYVVLTAVRSSRRTKRAVAEESAS